ncbi:XkdW family protein [Hathewaya massiliensis]|uniref:XkdW family protein n=1 Tax=Hathewaya massiliensis TaxID=1964382 RepID=UPI00115B0A03|nr:XkdW family protein [Hathewaya massiliensis]
MKQYIEGDYLITEYESGAIIKVLQGQEPKEVIPELPKNPILELQKQVDTLGQELAQSKVENVKKDNIINTLGQELAQVKIQLAGGR